MLGGITSFIIVVVSQGRLVGLLRGDATDGLKSSREFNKYLLGWMWVFIGCPD